MPSDQRTPTGAPTLAAPRAHVGIGQQTSDAFGLVVAVNLDVTAVGSDGDEALVRTVVLEPFDELAHLHGVGLAHRRVHGDGVDHPLDLAGRTQPLPAFGAHPDDVVRLLVLSFADRVEGVDATVAPDPHLLAHDATRRRQELRAGRGVLAAVLQVLLRPPGPLDGDRHDRHAALRWVSESVAMRPGMRSPERVLGEQRRASSEPAACTLRRSPSAGFGLRPHRAATAQRPRIRQEGGVRSWDLNRDIVLWKQPAAAFSS